MLLVRATLILAMAIGSVAMWIVVPVAWLYLASRLSQGSQPTLGPILLVMVGIPASMVIIGKGLASLNRLYARLVGADQGPRSPRPWMRSLRGERPTARPRSVLDVVMVISVSVALVLFAGWFFLLAGSSLPH